MVWNTTGYRLDLKMNDTGSISAQTTHKDGIRLYLREPDFPSPANISAAAPATSTYFKNLTPWHCDF
jgi:hypothetical protein